MYCSHYRLEDSSGRRSRRVVPVSTELRIVTRRGNVHDSYLSLQRQPALTPPWHRLPHFLTHHQDCAQQSLGFPCLGRIPRALRTSRLACEMSSRLVGRDGWFRPEVMEKLPRIKNEVLQVLGVQEEELCSFYHAALVY